MHRDGDGAALAGSPWRLEPGRAEPPAIPLPDLVGQINSLTRERLTNEFAIPGRVDNWHVCNSCWNDPRHRFDHKDYVWCLRHGGTDRTFECSRSITSDQVTAALDAIGIDGRPPVGADTPRGASNPGGGARIAPVRTT